jgi:hypothetical protein
MKAWWFNYHAHWLRPKLQYTANYSGRKFLWECETTKRRSIKGSDGSISSAITPTNVEMNVFTTNLKYGKVSGGNSSSVELDSKCATEDCWTCRETARKFLYKKRIEPTIVSKMVIEESDYCTWHTTSSK